MFKTIMELAYLGSDLAVRLFVAVFIFMVFYPSVFVTTTLMFWLFYGQYKKVKDAKEYEELRGLLR